MFKKSRTITLTAAAALLATGLVTTAAAQKRDRGSWDRGFRDRTFAQLDLTDTQREQIRDVRQRHEAELTEVRNRLRAAHDAHRAAVQALPVDEAKIRATSQALSEVEADLAVLRARMHGEAWALLTPEQQKKASELREQRQKRMQDRRDGMRKRMEGRSRG